MLDRARIAALLLMGALGGCSCEGGGVGSTTAGFRTATTSVDFGRALEGTIIARSIELSGTGRSGVTVEVSTSAPFTAPSTVEVPGGGTVPLELTFTAGQGPSEGTLTLRSNGESFEVALRGVGVRPLDCQPTASCREARFALETGSCVESLAPDGTSCTPAGLCLENGVCRAGSCVGTPRSCDDGNICTQDACAADVGCVHVDTSSQCPRPANVCEQAICDPVSGCGTAPRADDAICGSVDCVNAHFCRSGSCITVPTPEGFLCSPATPCQGEGHCSAGTCVRPDAGVMTPEWSVPLGDSPAEVAPERNTLLAMSGNLFFQSCNLTTQDGGCGLVSYTGNGFQRFVQPLDAGTRLRALGPFGALVDEGEALRALGTSTGQLAWSLPLTSDAGSFLLPRDAWAVTSGGTLALALSAAPPSADEVVYLELEAKDGGVLRSGSVPGARSGSALALGPQNAPWLAAPLAETLHGTTDGGQLSWTPLAVSQAVGRSLSVGNGGTQAFLGGAQAVDQDGGSFALLEPVDGGFGEEPLDLEVLSSGGVGFVFFRACRSPLPAPCTEEERATLVRAFSLSTGLPLWETRVLPGLAPGTIVDAQLVSGFPDQGVLTFTQAQLPDAGPRADLQLFTAGERKLLCPLDGAPQVRGALFDRGFLFVLLGREGKEWLEAYNLKGLTLSQSGWPRLGGTPENARRER